MSLWLATSLLITHLNYWAGFKTGLLLDYVRTPASIYYPPFKNTIRMMNESQNSDQSQNAEKAEKKINPMRPKSVRVG